MAQSSLRVHFLHAQLLLLEIAEPGFLRFTHVVMVTRVARRHEGRLRVISDGRNADAGSALAIVEALSRAPTPRQLVFAGSEAALRDLATLLAHLAREDDAAPLPSELEYVQRAG